MRIQRVRTGTKQCQRRRIDHRARGEVCTVYPYRGCSQLQCQRHYCDEWRERSGTKTCTQRDEGEEDPSGVDFPPGVGLQAGRRDRYAQ